MRGWRSARKFLAPPKNRRTAPKAAARRSQRVCPLAQRVRAPRARASPAARHRLCPKSLRRRTPVSRKSSARRPRQWPAAGPGSTDGIARTVASFALLPTESAAAFHSAAPRWPAAYQCPCPPLASANPPPGCRAPAPVPHVIRPPSRPRRPAGCPGIAIPPAAQSARAWIGFPRGWRSRPRARPASAATMSDQKLASRIAGLPEKTGTVRSAAEIRGPEFLRRGLLPGYRAAPRPEHRVKPAAAAPLSQSTDPVRSAPPSARQSAPGGFVSAPTPLRGPASAQPRAFPPPLAGPADRRGLAPALCRHRLRLLQRTPRRQSPETFSKPWPCDTSVSRRRHPESWPRWPYSGSPPQPTPRLLV